MSTIVVPALDEEPYPTLGDQVAAWIEAFTVHGPGDLRGQPYRLDDEKRALLYRMYEIYPEDHPQAGRRRFKRVAISLRKGSAKTEFAAVIAAAELHPDAPVRCDGFDGRGNPIGRGVQDPYIPMVAYTEEQSEELAYGALKSILEEGPLADDFDIGLERIMRKDGSGKAVAVASSPNATDGARTTFQHFDETHRFVLPRLKTAHRTMLANIPKRKLADAWSLETTTAPAPGEGSIAEQTMDYARQVQTGATTDSRLFFFHREAASSHKLDTPACIRAAVIEASGPIAEWSDIESIVEQFRDPTADLTYLRRVWLNQLVRGADRAFDMERWKPLAQPEYLAANNAQITLGFDGSRAQDATALVATEITNGHVWPIQIWQRPLGVETWEVPRHEVHVAIDEAFRRYKVWRLYADPPYWETELAEWAGKYGSERVTAWWTNRWKQIAYAVRAFDQAILGGDLHHSGHALLTEHVGNAVRMQLTLVDDQKQRLWVIQKERPDSPHKIDAAMAAILSWQARLDAVASGVGKKGRSVYEDRGIRRL